MEIYNELMFMFQSTLGIEISNLNFNAYGEPGQRKTTLLRVYEKDVPNSVLTINLDRMRVTDNSPMTMKLDEVVKQTLREFMETEYFINKISSKKGLNVNEVERLKLRLNSLYVSHGQLMEFIQSKGLLSEFINIQIDASLDGSNPESN